MKQSGDKTSFSVEEREYMKEKCNKRDRAKFEEMLTDMQPAKEPRRLRVLRSQLPLRVKAEVFRALAENDSPKYEEWVEHALRIPFGKYTARPSMGDSEFIRRAERTMDSEITGHDEAKREVLRSICSWLENGGSTGFALGLEGEPGVGKTSFVKRALSKGMDRPFCFISLGGSSDASGLLGHSYTYEGAVPGRLVECLRTSAVMDPIIYFDELDKISCTGKGEELVHALIHLTDPVQNSHVRDRYLHGIDIDLSRAVLVFSYNDPSRVNPVLLDRIKRIHLSTPSTDARIQICKNHLIPRSLGNRMDLTLPDDAIEYIVQKNANEPGMRGIEKDIAHAVSSFALIKMYGSSKVLGLCHDTENLDLRFVRDVLFPRDRGLGTDRSTSHLLMYL